MKIIDSRGLKLLYKTKRLKKLSLRFAKLIHKKYPYLELCIDYFEEKQKETTVKMPIFVIGIPDDLVVKDEKKFLEGLGELLDMSGNLSEVDEMFMLSVEKISDIEERINANI